MGDKSLNKEHLTKELEEMRERVAELAAMVSELKSTQESLQESDKKLRAILDSIGEGIIVTDLEGTIIDVNTAAIRLHGYSRKEELIGQNGADFISQKDHPKALAAVKEAYKIGVSGIIEYTALDKDGREFFGEARSALLCDSSGKPAGLVFIERDVSKRKLLESALRDSEEKIRGIFESIGDGIVVTDMEGRIIEANETALRYAGYSHNKEALLGHSAMEFIGEEDRDAAAKAMMGAFEKGRGIVMKFRMLGGKEGAFDGEAAATIIRDNSGNPIGLIAAIRDISDRKRMEKTLRESEEKLRTTFESITDAICIIDREGRILDVNEAAVSMAGLSDRKALIGLNAIEFVAEKDRPAVSEDIRDMVRDERALERVEYVVLDVNGREIDIELSSGILCDGSGSPIGLVVVVRDISERKRAEEVLRESEEEIRNIFESTCEGIMVTDPMGNIIEANEAVLQLHGYKNKAELFRINSIKLISKKDRARLAEDSLNAVKGGRSFSGEYLLLRTDGTEFEAECRMSVMYDIAGKPIGIVGVSHDITDRKKAQKELELAYKDLKSAQDYVVQTERLRALGEMASGVAHDFNNVLAVILGRAELALEDMKDAKLKKDLQVIQQTALDASSTVRRLQDFSRVRVGHALEAVDIEKLVQDALQMVESRQVQLKETASINIDIVTKLSQAGPVLGDAAELKQALVNIIFNSIDAMPKGGKITIASGQENKLVVLSISDTGEGIPAEVKGRIFDPFFTTRGSKGSGLGLSVAYGIVKRHGGQINFESAVGKGTTFFIRLPIARGVEQKVPAEPKVQTVKGARILLVDDDPEVSEVLGLMIKKLGHEVAVINAGKTAISAFKAGHFDIVITDLGMPDLSGREVAKAIKKDRPDTPVLLITGWGVQLELDKMPEIDGVIAKPFGKDVLSAKIGELLANKLE